jgi:hypothetical protein
MLQKAFFGLFSGVTPDTHHWLDHVDMTASQRVAAAG